MSAFGGTSLIAQCARLRSLGRDFRHDHACGYTQVNAQLVHVVCTVKAVLHGAVGCAHDATRL